MQPKSVSGNVGVATGAISCRRKDLRGWLKSLTLWGSSDFKNSHALQSRQSSQESSYGFYKTKRCLWSIKDLTLQTQEVIMIVLHILREYSYKKKTMSPSRNLCTVHSIEISTLNRTSDKWQRSKRNDKMKKTTNLTCLEVWRRTICKSNISGVSSQG